MPFGVKVRSTHKPYQSMSMSPPPEDNSWIVVLVVIAVAVIGGIGVLIWIATR